MRYTIYLLLLCLTTTHFNVYGQSSFKSPEELKKTAGELFEKGSFNEAFPLYSQLLSVDRQDPELLYRFGVCMLYSDRTDTYKPISYLNKALDKVDNPDLYYYLGFAHHINYNFPTAIYFYNEYISRTGPNTNKDYHVQRKIEMCNNGISMMKSIKDLYVLEKTEVGRDEFFRSYDLTQYGGTIIRKPDEFLTKTDLKNGVKDYVFFSRRADVVFYSAYNKDHKDQRDIYKRNKLQDGSWSEPIKLPSIINSQYDEDFPVMLADGRTLYFSSKGHNTIGGYDIFKSLYDSVKNSWSKPENINFPFNTPVDDILFIPDDSELTAWFASDRNTTDEAITVYNVGILKRPEGSEDLATIYEKNKKLSQEDLQKFQNKALLDKNISKEEFESIEFKKEDLVSQTEAINKEREAFVEVKKERTERAQSLIDSASIYIIATRQHIDKLSQMENEYHLLATGAKNKSNILRDEIRNVFKELELPTPLEVKEEKLDAINNKVIEAEISDFEAKKYDKLAFETSENLNSESIFLNEVIGLFGDIENDVYSDRQDNALTKIEILNNRINSHLLSSDKKTLNPETDFEYPTHLTNENDLSAFQLNGNNEDWTIEINDARYQKYVPHTLLAKIGQIEYVRNASSPLELNMVYKTRLANYQKSLEDNLDSIENLQKQAQIDYYNLPGQKQEEKLVELNKIENNRIKLIGQKEQISVIMGESAKIVDPSALSNTSWNKEDYNKANKYLESQFDFETNKLKTIEEEQALSAVRKYKISDNKSLVKEKNEFNFLNPDEIDFEEESYYPVVESDAFTMLVESSEKIRANIMAKEQIESLIAKINNSAQSEFNSAMILKEQIDNQFADDQNKTLNEANQKLSKAYELGKESEVYIRAKEKISNNISEQNQKLDILKEEYIGLKDALKNRNVESSKTHYKKIESQYDEIVGSEDFYNEFGNPFKNRDIQSIENIPVKQYLVLSENNKVALNPQYNNIDLSSLDPFIVSINNVSTSGLMIADNIALNNSYVQISDSLFPYSIPEDNKIAPVTIKLPSQILEDDNAIVSNSVSLIDSLVSGINNVIEKRSALNTHFNKELIIAKEQEEKSLSIIKSDSLTIKHVEEANQVALKSTKHLSGAIYAASAVNQYDKLIENYIKAIEASVPIIENIKKSVDIQQFDDALNFNTQLQEYVISVEQIEIEDELFDYGTQSMSNYPTAAIEGDEEVFFVENGVIYRNEIDYFKLLEDMEVELSIESFESNSVLKIVPEDFVPVSSAAGIVAMNQSESDKPATNQTSDEKTVEPETEIVALNNENDSLLIDTSNLGLPSFNEDSLLFAEEIRRDLLLLNTTAQDHINKIDYKSAAMTLMAEERLLKSNALLFESEKASGATRKMLRDSADKTLYEAMAIRSFITEYDKYAVIEREKLDKTLEETFSIESDLEQNKLEQAQKDLNELQLAIAEFKSSPESILSKVNKQLVSEYVELQPEIDSLYNVSQKFTNKSVDLFTQASEERKKAERKKNAFKRRKLLNEIELKEIRATQLQNKSELALSKANNLYNEQRKLSKVTDVFAWIESYKPQSIASVEILANQASILNSIDKRAMETFSHTHNKTLALNSNQDSTVSIEATGDKVQNYEKEYFKADLLSKELELILEEIAYLDQNVNPEQTFSTSAELERRLVLLKNQADSLSAVLDQNKAANQESFESLSESGQKQVNETTKDVNNYINTLREKIEKASSEASSLRQRAQRTNDINLRNQLLQEANDKDKIAMFLVLDELEVIAQKNKTQYQKNRLLLNQLTYEKANLEERLVMQGIFSQIDSYMQQAAEKRKKAEEDGLNYEMKKILLQDAYTLEMKALDLQLVAKNMIESHDRNTLIALAQNIEGFDLASIVSEEVINTNEFDSIEQTRLQSNLANNKTDENQIPIIDDASLEGLTYRVQFVALRELLKPSDFPGIMEVEAQQIPEKNLYRYFSGRFDNYADALIRRNTIRSEFYNDAFIKSYKDGEEIELLSLIETEVDVESSSNAGLGQTSATEEVDYAATNISSLQGVYYTVQLGVFSRVRTSALLFGISPLYHRKTNNGFWVYYSGIFTTIANAESKRQAVVEQGIEDAFVVAFSNGEEITLAEARIQISSGSATPDDDAIVILEDASARVDEQLNNTIESVNQTTQSLQSNSTELNNQMIYKVQVGVYSNPVNLSWISSQLNKDYRVDSYINANGKYVYTVGEFQELSKAKELLTEAKELVSDAFVAGFQNGNKTYIR
jgi:hypothetical protein